MHDNDAAGWGFESFGLEDFGLESTIAAATSTFLASSLDQVITIQAVSLTSLVTSATSSFAATTTAAAAVASATSAPSDGSENTGECKLLGPFAILVQAALGGLALLVLVFKRWRERPQRPLKIWAFDASKQVFGSVLLHLLNLLMSMFSAGQIEASVAALAASTIGTDSALPGDDDYQPNPCSFYLLNLAIDTTIGIPILILILRVLTVGASYTPIARPPESIQSGNYGRPPKATWWLKQSLVYFIGLLGMKICVFIVFELCPWIVQVGDWALRWTEGNEAIQIAFVMLIFPLIMNALQYYIIDTFIKKKNTEEPENEYTEGGSDDSEHNGLLGEDSQTHGTTIDEEEACKSDAKSTVKEKRKPKSKRIKSYDPDKDGDIPGTPVGESSSSGASRTEEEAVKHAPTE